MIENEKDLEDLLSELMIEEADEDSFNDVCRRC
uniref:Uncharacterized protein n=1 Tax=Clostridium perfringens TaxID=1502 RepID=A0A4Y5T4K0_CLOPF|nr:hypothetical protein [Clostridium perfringens]